MSDPVEPDAGPAQESTPQAEWLAGVTAPPTTTAPSPSNDLATALRRVTEAVVGRDLPEDELARGAEEMAALADRLEQAAAPGKAARRMPDRDGPPQDYFDTSPVVGFANPVAPPARIWAVETEDGQVEMRGQVRFGYAYEGPPTCVHGGAIAQLFDELLGTTNILTGHGAMTGTLTVRYRRPTPLLADLDLQARLVGVDGRKVHLWGAIANDGLLTAEADGIFIEAGQERMLDIAAANAAASRGQVLDEALGEALQMARSRPSQ